ncbi:hypothetical protein LTR50_002014 [Elasticomyces elasticus]|nr:hypothetical protein LTR50_002014 [Elasticomyces elasticus]
MYQAMSGGGVYTCTFGPPIATPLTAPSALASPDDKRASGRRTTALSPGAASDQQQQQQQPNLDLSFLRSPTIYHTLPTSTIPSPFLHSPHQPPPDTPLAHLLQNGHFRHAASAAAKSLTTPPTTSNPIPILDLFYTRLACLTLLHRPDLAAAEAKPLLDYLARAAAEEPPQRGGAVVARLVPWPLRLLLVRLQGTADAGGDGRRGVMALYALGQEVREEMALAWGNSADEEVWRARLSGLGVSVAGALIEMGELEAARRHLSGLEVDGRGGSEARRMMVLLWLRIGDVEAAERCLGGGVGESGREVQRGILSALIQMADGDLVASAASWRALRSLDPANELVAQNLAVCLLYTGQIAEASLSLLTPPFPPNPQKNKTSYYPTTHPLP